MPSPSSRVYHERQTRQLCALHTLNNLFQSRQAFTKEQMDEICTNLNPNVWLNPHRSMLGLGNYDINVIMRALQLHNCEACWFDKRKDPSCIDLNAIFGFILNVPSDYKFGFITLPLRKRHWIAVRAIDGKYYNLDSKLHGPECIGNEQQLFAFLHQQLQSNDRELFVIVELSANGNDQQQPKKWLRDDTATPALATTENDTTTTEHSVISNVRITAATNSSTMNGHIS